MPTRSDDRAPVASRAVQAIVFTGLIAGTIDIAQALIQFGLGTPFSIAAALLGRPAVAARGPALWVLGMFLHYLIATTATAIYYTASRRLAFLLEHPLVCGLLYGMAVENFMNLVVLPLSALHAAGPYELHDLLNGIATHMITVGLPIAYGLRYFTRSRASATQ
jgi:hypothetical protein